MTKEELKRVVGLAYEPGEGLPQVILKGHGTVAENILSQSKRMKNGPMIVEDEVLLKKLYALPIDSDISPQLFGLVAVLLAHVFAVDAKSKGDVHG